MYVHTHIHFKAVIPRTDAQHTGTYYLHTYIHPSALIKVIT